jgi:tetratricopeptide (TPR) repeat protein
MDEFEKLEFDKLVNDNRQLKKEVELYQQIRLTSDSILRKIDSFHSSPPALEDEDSEMITKARKHWEARNKKKPIPILPASTDAHRKKKVINLNRWTLLIAASFIGVVIVLFTFDLSRNETRRQQLAQKKDDPAKPGNPANVKPAAPANVNSQAAGTPETTYHRNDNISRKKQPHSSVSAPTGKEIASIFNDHFMPDAIPEHIDERLQNAINDYEESRYETAVLGFTKTEQLMPRGYEETESSTSFYIPYYKGISYLAIGDTEKAISDLKMAVSRHPDITLRSKAEWYLALAYLKKRDTERALRLFEKLSNNRQAAEYKDRSQKIIRELKKH